MNVQKRQRQKYINKINLNKNDNFEEEQFTEIKY